MIALSGMTSLDMRKPTAVFNPITPVYALVVVFPYYKV